MKKKTLFFYSFFCSITLLGLQNACFASTAGDVTLINNNQLTAKNSDSLQFQLLSNGDGLVTSMVLTAQPPTNSHTLSKWDFTDQTLSFKVFVRNVSKKEDYNQCTEEINYSANHSIISIYAWSDGQHSHCRYEQVVEK